MTDCFSLEPKSARLLQFGTKKRLLVTFWFDCFSLEPKSASLEPIGPKALSGVSDWVDSTQSLVPCLYWKTSPWYNLNCTKGLGGIHPVPETWFDGSKDSSGATYQAISINTDGRAIPPLPTDIGLGPH